MIHIYYGFGRGKTSTLNGTALRGLSAAKKVEYIRFLKGRPTGEDKQLEKLGIKIKYFHHTSKFVMEMTPLEKEETRRKVIDGLNAISASKADLILIDEGLDLIETGLATEDELILALQNPFNNNADILISGHYILKDLFKLAGLITYFKPEKHYYNEGVKAKEGIEF
ncbi:MAG: cob(I)yrinic acid a,c-diamide adenosyltransferase [Mycoplasmatales bacterium]|nr:cob(I)yrinic acid a,c-diamide adenosyltransferase [Mycoplasmatales bacterium]